MANTNTIMVREVPAWKVNLPYVALVGIMVGQAVASVYPLLGQFVYIVTNIITTYHAFALGRPRADKIQNIACFALTLAIIIIKTAN